MFYSTLLPKSGQVMSHRWRKSSSTTRISSQHCSKIDKITKKIQLILK